jgi:enterochelin esterase family protein
MTRSVAITQKRCVAYRIVLDRIEVVSKQRRRIMRQHLIGFMLSLVASGSLCLGQTTQPIADDWKPSVTNRPGQQYPRINSQHRAQFRITAPQATNVAVNVAGTASEPPTVTKGDDGVWTITTGTLDLGFHFYRVLVDGANFADSATEVYCGGGGGGLSSAIEVPTGEDFYELKNVPHGEVRERQYFSKSTQAWRRIFIYTPPGYDQNPSNRYPVLYLQHGGGEDERGWPVQGHVASILDNLIAEGKAKPFLVVMENGSNTGGARGGAPAGGAPAGGARRGAAPAAAATTNPAQARGGRGGGGAFNSSAFERIVVDDLIPFIDSNYRTIADQAHRGMAGLSMGAMQSRQITLANLDKFAYIGLFSGGTFSMDDVNNIPGFKEKVKLAFSSYGSRELGGNRGGGRGVGGARGEANAAPAAGAPATAPAGARGGRGGGDPQANAEALKQAGINAVFYVSPGTAHEWHTWRRSLNQFAPLLFKD